MAGSDSVNDPFAGINNTATAVNDKDANDEEVQRQQQAAAGQPGQPSNADALNASMGNTAYPYEFGSSDGPYKIYRPNVIGDPNYATNKANVAGRISAIDSRGTQSMTAAQMQGANINQVPQGQFRQRQVGLADALTASMNGAGPSVAEQQLQRSTDATIKQQMALAASARGANPAVAAKMAADNAAAAQQQSAGQAAELRAGEQIAARGQLASVLDASRGADIGMATSQAGLDQSTNSQNATMQQQSNAANLDSSVQQQAQKDALVQQYLSMGMSLDQANQQAQISQYQFATDQLNRGQAAARGVALQAAAQGQQVAGAIAGAVGTLGGALLGGPAGAAAGGAAGNAVGRFASDKRVKKNITDGEVATRAFLRSLSPKGFDYKDEKHGKGRFLGVMAQDVERGAPDIVVDDESDGIKKIDVAKALSASLASLGSMNKRLEKVEGKRGAA